MRRDDSRPEGARRGRVRLDSIRARLALAFIGALALALALVQGLLFLDFRQTLQQSVDGRLKSAALIVARALAHPEREPGGEERQGDLGDALDAVRSAYGSEGVIVAVFDRQGRPELRPPSAAELRLIPVGKEEVWRTVGPEETAQRIFALPVGDRIVEAASPWDPIEDSLEHLGGLLVLLFALFLAFAGVGAWILVGAALRPIEGIALAANRISADRLTERLPFTASDREIQQLVRTLNRMIDRLADAFDSQRQFVADASHELRTPITIVRNEVEVALGRARSPAEYRRVLTSVLDEADRMSRLVGDLLVLARGEAGAAPAGHVEVPLEDLCRLVAAEFRPVAAARGIALHADLPAEGPVVSGDPGQLRRLLENLVENAVNYTPGPGEVRLSLAREGESALIAVADTGPGIAAEHLPRLFERFYRVEKSRSRALGGSGLGLAIARQIAGLHGGTVSAESEPGRGSRFIIQLPLAERMARSA